MTNTITHETSLTFPSSMPGELSAIISDVLSVFHGLSRIHLVLQRTLTHSGNCQNMISPGSANNNTYRHILKQDGNGVIHTN